MPGILGRYITAGPRFAHARDLDADLRGGGCVRIHQEQRPGSELSAPFREQRGQGSAGVEVAFDGDQLPGDLGVSGPQGLGGREGIGPGRREEEIDVRIQELAYGGVRLDPSEPRAVRDP